MRVVSLVPSITETLLDWHVDVVACTRFCEQPVLAHVGGTKDPDVAAIVALRPDLVIVDREENRREDADALMAAGIAVHVTHVCAYSDVEPTLQRLAAAVAVPAAAADAVPVSEPWASAFIAIWRRPWMSVNADTYGSSLLARVGVVNVFGDHPERYPTTDLAEVADRRPDLVVLPSEPYAFAARHAEEVYRAVPDAAIRFVDGRDVFWWGVRSAAAVSRIRAALRAAPSPRR